MNLEYCNQVFINMIFHRYPSGYIDGNDFINERINTRYYLNQEAIIFYFWYDFYYRSKSNNEFVARNRENIRRSYEKSH